MLRVQMVSGSELCALDADVLASSELSDIRSLKRHLVSLCGASRFRQRLFCDRFDLEDDMMLKVPMDLQLVLLPFCSSSDKDIDILVAAASLGDVEIVEKLLQRPQDPDGHNGDFDSPLHLAAENGHAEVVQLLLEAEASVDLLAWQGEPPLCLASRRGHVDIVRLLLEGSAETDGHDAFVTPLWAACEEGRLEVARLLLEAEADPNLPNDSGATPLDQAIQGGHLEIRCLLLEAGAQEAPSSPQEVRRTPPAA
ncbi:unnamed protein product [Durusdinium trenchii]|uniref:Uncharacterized protein n=1 Tax=Durusdinium trenchii TaxID=1381693 RepID=A0ABP0ICD2_9DINO